MNRENNDVYRCGIYLRLSREDLLKKDESSSIASQRMIIKSFAEHNNFNIVSEYADDGYSGGNFDRPAFKKLIDDIEKGVINCVITKDLSRFGRELYNTGKYIEDYFAEKNIRYIAINDSYDSLVGDSMLGVRLSVNDLYLRDASKKVKASFKAKMEKGEFLGSSACYGYKKDPNDHHHLIIDPPAAKIVKYIFKLALEGLGGRSIANHLNELNIQTPNAYKNNVSFLSKHPKTYWTHVTVNYILHNRTYVGDLVQHTCEKVSYNSKKIRKVPLSDQIIVPNTHEAIISREDFQTVQESKIKRRVVYAKTSGNYLLSGLLFCGGCGHAMGISKVTKVTRNCSAICRCNFYNRIGKNSECTPNRVNYNYLEADIVNYIKEICISLASRYNSTALQTDVININYDNINQLKNQIEEKKQSINLEEQILIKMYNDRLNDVISSSMYKNMAQLHEDKILELKNELNLLNVEYTSLNNELKSTNVYECLREKIDEFLKFEYPSNELVRDLIERILIYDEGENKRVEVFFKFNELINNESSSI